MKIIVIVLLILKIIVVVPLHSNSIKGIAISNELRLSNLNNHNDNSIKKKRKVRVDELLVNRGLASDLNHAKALIMSRLILDKDGNYINSHAMLLKEDDEIRHKVNKNQKAGDFVSRAGINLSHAIESFKLQDYIKEARCIDIGASTGGFTDVLLRNDAAIVYAVDVGVSLLDWKIRSNEKVRVIEKTNARYLNSTVIQDSGQIDVVVCDCSFISLKHVLPPSLMMCNVEKEAIVICLIKPQFECDRHEISDGGIVTDELVRKRVVDNILDWFQSIYKNWTIIDVIESPISGTNGNIEYLFVAKKKVVAKIS
jgi:23S rRNA (cytidine1920-2'-O)/16S rRNA (cytidine1409-2'-O)-methyltransferase